MASNCVSSNLVENPGIEILFNFMDLSQVIENTRAPPRKRRRIRTNFRSLHRYPQANGHESYILGDKRAPF